MPTALLTAMTEERWIDALAIASKFTHLGPQKAAIQRAHNAQRRPDFYRELGQDPAVLLQEGIAALRARYE